MALAGRGRMRGLNREWRGVDRPTDVLSLPFHEKKDLRALSKKYPVILGEIVICPEVADKNARQAGLQPGDEVRRLLVHGYLHLLGYDHETGARQAALMRRKERELLDVLAR